MVSTVQRIVTQTPGQDETERLSPEDSDANPASETTFTKDDMTVWTWMVSKGIANALTGLSKMVGHEIMVNSLDLKRIPAKNIAALLGEPESIGVGVYLTIEGDATGHLLLMHDIKVAFELIDMQLGLPLGSTQKIEEMERSILGEMGNITGSFFLNTLADTTGMILEPSPPAVIVDMVRAIINIPLAFIMEKQDDALVVKATFCTDDQQLSGTFMVIPTTDFIKAILKGSSATIYT